MPKDDFKRLERRWRERPLFLERPSRRPFWMVMFALLLAAGLLVGIATVGPPGGDSLLPGFAQRPFEIAPDRTAHAVPSGSRRPLTPAGQ